jgi:hypothetical protein
MLTAVLKPTLGSGEMEITGKKVFVLTSNERLTNIDLIKDKIFRAFVYGLHGRNRPRFHEKSRPCDRADSQVVSHSVLSLRWTSNPPVAR